MNKIKHGISLLNQVKNVFFTHSWNYFKRGYQVGALKSYVFHYFRHAFNFTRHFGNRLINDLGQPNLDHPSMKRLRFLTKGIHQLLPTNSFYSYSILIAVTETSLSLFKQTLESAIQQTAPLSEILISCPPSLSLEIKNYLDEQKHLHASIQVFDLPYESELEMLNALSHKAQYHWITCLGATDWIRPDFLFRCEQLLRMQSNNSSYCLFAKEIPIHETGLVIATKETVIDREQLFPYQFQNTMGRCCLIQRLDFIEAGGLKFNPKEEGFWELGWRLYHLGVQFHYLPFPLSMRNFIKKEHHKNTRQLFESLNNHCNQLNLDWTWQAGETLGSYRAIPSLDTIPSIQVIIPFKDQKKLTLKAVEKALAQEGVSVFVTAVDNNSQDLSIGQAIEAMGGEVLKVKEPFNYSRLNNLAVEKTTTAKHCDLILFLNNDVDLEPDALLEMCRWIHQPGIGLVGCQLFYPDGTLQHGGVDLILNRPFNQMMWSHSERAKKTSKRTFTRSIRICHAVTAACALMKKQIFKEIGGFDETWYPIAYSDTNLAVKLQAQGLRCLYTPYAKGIHHESVSREHENIEDVEHSSWLQDHYLDSHGLKFSNYLSSQQIPLTDFIESKYLSCSKGSKT